MKRNETVGAFSLLLLLVASSTSSLAQGDQEVLFRAIEIFPLVNQNVHGSTIVELPNGDLLAAWFQGSGERWADDVAIMGARLRAGKDKWTKPFVMADVPGFPDINPILFLDPQDRLWLMWYTVTITKTERVARAKPSSTYSSTRPGSNRVTVQNTNELKAGANSCNGENS